MGVDRSRSFKNENRDDRSVFGADGRVDAEASGYRYRFSLDCI